MSQSSNAQSLRNGKSIICSMPHCDFYFANPFDFARHMIFEHGFPDCPLIETYSFAYSSIDRKDSYKKFAHVCGICFKGNGYRINESPTTTFEENEIHLYEHMGVPFFGCTRCSTWCWSKRQADVHALTHQKGILTMCQQDYIVIEPESDWGISISYLIENLNLSLDYNQQYFYRSNVQMTKEEKEFLRIFHIFESHCYSLNDIKGYVYKVFTFCGNWQSVGHIIQSSSATAVKLCYDEIKTSLIELIMHPRAFNSIATLLFQCDPVSWNHFLITIALPENRKKLIHSSETAHLFRRLLTNEAFPGNRFANLSLVFTIEELERTSAKPIFLSAIASRPGPAAAKLCTIFTDKIDTLGCHHLMSQCIQTLIKTASKAIEKVETLSHLYEEFLENVSGAIPSLLDSHYGRLTVQCQIFHSSFFCIQFINQVVTLEWIFGNIGEFKRYQLYDYQQICEAAICACSPEDICQFAVNLLWSERKIEVLHEHFSANNILREIIKRISDYHVLYMIQHRLSSNLSFLRYTNKLSQDALKIVSVVTDLATKRLHLSKYQFKQNKYQ